MISSSPTHVIRWEFDKMSEVTVDSPRKDSPSTIIEGLSWRIGVHAESNARAGNVPKLALSVHCAHPTAKHFWKCENQFRFNMRSSRDIVAKNLLQGKHTKPLYRDHDNYGVFFGELANLMDPEKGFLLDDKMIMEVSITIHRTVGVGIIISLRDFAEPNETCDVCLIVECKRIHVAKAVLATISPVLKTMLYGKFEESAKREIEIHDVKHTDFVNFLNVVYSSLHAIDDASVEGILSIADRFNAKLTEWYTSFSDKLKGQICDRMMEIMGDS